MENRNSTYESLVELARSVHEWSISIGRPFACPGDVLFVRSNNKYTSNANIQYQKLRRPDISNDNFRFTHVGIVTSTGVVAHSLPHKGRLLEKIIGPDSRAYGFGKSGVTLDSLSSSGFLDKENVDFLVLRNPRIFERPDLHIKINQSALYYFGVSYNFSIDLKKYRYTKESERYMLHCSEFVERVLVESDVKEPCMVPSNVLPVDNYVDLISAGDWVDVTGDYKSDKFYEPDEFSTEFHLKIWVILTTTSIQQAYSVAKISNLFRDFDNLFVSIKKNPDRYKKEIEGFIESDGHPSIEGFLKNIYKILTRISPQIPKIHIIDEISTSFQLKLDSIIQSSGQDLLAELVSQVHRWHLEAITIYDLISTGCIENKDDVLTLLHSMIARSDAIIVKMDSLEEVRDSFKVAILFARLGNIKQRKHPGSGLFALTLSGLAQSIARMKALAMIFIVDASYSDLIGRFTELLPKEELRNADQDLIIFSCVDLSSLKNSFSERLVLDFSRLLR
jgi:hypothetical protein